MKSAVIERKDASHHEAATEELSALEMGSLDPSAFPHSEHVRLAYGMLERYPFGEAVARFSRGVKLLAAKAGRPEVYHETITVAFLAVIGERRARAKGENWAEFKANNGDLFDKRCLGKWYGAEQLGSDLARRTFCLPQGAAISKSPS
ncbi:MAG: hypothetical protein LC642_01260 [Verrucomicrobiaceae bacterium]|nr:hypothetical protein [Verrucomicrobiaceae bacterium]